MAEQSFIPFNPAIPFHGDSTLGNEVVVLWGSPGWRQKESRATVARFPYLQVERNDQVDVEKIPRPA